VSDAIRKGRGSKYHKEGREAPPAPASLADLLFCEALNFAVLPWQLDDMDVQTFAYWSQVVSAYRDEKAKAELRRQKEESADARGRRARR